jgi:hypothetical protein
VSTLNWPSLEVNSLHSGLSSADSGRAEKAATIRARDVLMDEILCEARPQRGTPASRVPMMSLTETEVNEKRGQSAET